MKKMGKSITSRLPDDMIKEINRISEIEKLDKSSVIRKLLDRAIKIWKIENAIEYFRNNKISLGKAAEIAELSIWEFLNKLQELKIPIHYDVDNLKQDLELIDKEL